MKIRIFDTFISNPNGSGVNVYFDLKHELERLQKEEKAQIKAVKLIFTSPGSEDAIFAIYYEKPSVIKQKSFDSMEPCSELDSKINDFMKNHDVIKVEHFNGAYIDEITAVITDKED